VPANQRVNAAVRPVTPRACARVATVRPARVGRSRLTHHATGPALRHSQEFAHVRDRAPPSTVRAQYFPEDTSFKIEISIAWSATSLFSRKRSSNGVLDGSTDV